jgi:hypothetical protein
MATAKLRCTVVNPAPTLSLASAKTVTERRRPT